ncbi:MAG: CHAP domain-containing protein [Bifidobacterium tibiigranuli]|jgi:surface antigen|uniref:CHAP domain-containing protein n=1 Tax=Bifidobacterium tibiigranuli TaxID=2172043 RepID=UPI0026ECB644|nr:CHAP domain-containing protein [Bifidobacterium tibiigranuli]MCI1649385.1 CHAP domain-containing protein [Bifidobacterium tibiigranuli]MCI1672969.1 CHAP domain-containing protein [Bifidobacterium tibiigranuli]MCI1714109.1 CHAP domain-containing protein [Bifidobacterium tibiigranuli]
MKARTHQAGTVRFGQLNVKSRKGGMNFHREGAALGRRRGAQSIVSNERRKKSRLLSRLSSGMRSTTTTLTGRDQRDMNERIGDKSKQLLQTGAKRFARTGVKAGATVARKTTVRAARSTATTVRKTATLATRKAASVAARKVAHRAARKATQSTARKATAKAARKTAQAAARTTANIARQAVALATRAATAVAAAVSSMSLPLIMGIVILMAVITLITSLFSWLPGAANDQNTQTSSANYPITDDYPYKGHYNDGTSPLGYEYGNCTDFVAWRINRDAGVTAAPWKYKWAQLTPLGGNGGQWGLAGNLPGWNVTTTPSAGDIISIPAGVAILGASGGPYGHVGYIAQVSGGSVLIENYGGGKYFQTNPTTSQLASYVASGQAVIKHNPLGRSASGSAGGTGTDAKSYAKSALNDDTQYNCLVQLWDHESGWRVDAENASSGAYGIPQALPGSKMASSGSDWKTNGVTQVKWGLGYIKSRPDYGTPCAAWEKWQSRSPHWY